MPHGRTQITGFLLFALAIFASSALFADLPTETDFLVEVNGVVEPYSPRAVFVLPGESVRVGVDAETESTSMEVGISGGSLKQVSERKWIWEAPEEIGSYQAVLRNAESGDMQVLNLFVMRPFKEIKKGILNGFRLGKYPKRAPAGYEPPRGFIEVTEENEDTHVSAHFQLKQFVCRQKSGYPKYVPLNESLVSKLERLLDKARENGFYWSGFRILSAFRSPYHNGSQRRARLSRHMYGDAADITVDENGDGRMDDLNKDGKVDVQDSVLLHDMVYALEREDLNGVRLGGVGVYAHTRHHGPFVHVDARGTKAVWVKGIRRRVASRFSSSMQ